MDFKMNEAVRRAIENAKNEVRNKKSTKVTDEFLFFTLFKEVQHQAIGKAMSAKNFNVFTLRYYVDNKANLVEEPGFDVNDEITLSLQTIETLNMAQKFAELTDKDEIISAHVFLALLETDNKILTNYMRDYCILPEMVRKDCIEFIYTGKISSLEVVDKTKEKPQKLDKIIEDTCTDLTALALNGQIDPIIGREKEIDAIINTMARRSKNNVLIAAPEGVGKTAIVKGLALKLANNEIPSLANKRIFSLSIGSLMSNSMYRGQLEERVTNLIKALSNMKNAILFIDELHMICKSGTGKESSTDIAGLLKTELANKSLQLIGCTTLKELRILQEDPAFLRRLNVIKLEEPSEEEALDIMKGLVYKYEKFHNVEIPEETLKCAVKLAKRYIAERYLPDSAIDVLDSSAAKLKLKATANQKDNDKAKELQLVLLEDELLKSETETSRCIEIFKEYQVLKAKLEEPEEETEEIRPILTADNIADEVEVRTGIPTSRLMASDKAKLLQLENELHERIIGQDLAIKEISNAIRRNSSGLSNPNKPIASFLFAGPTGVGKTEVCKALAELRYGSRDNIIRIDCSEFSEAHSVSKLIGAAPGYIGFDKGGQLTEAVRNKPFSIVLFDEFEKAKGNLTNIMLQILDDGRLTDSNGVTVSFKNCIIVLTTNLGSGLLSQSRPVGFGVKDSEQQEQTEYEALKEKTMDTIKSSLSPEFINRLSATVVFHPLNKEQQRQITRLMGRKIDERLAEQDIVAKCSNEALDFITDKGYDQQYGARPLERALVKYIEEPLSLLLLEDKIKPGDYVYIELVDEELVFNVKEEVEV